MLLGVGAVVFTAGLAAVFAGVGLRARVVGLAVMALGALLSLLAADPREWATWWMAAMSVLTLCGLLAFAAGLARAVDGDRSLDDEPLP